MRVFSNLALATARPCFPQELGTFQVGPEFQLPVLHGNARQLGMYEWHEYRSCYVGLLVNRLDWHFQESKGNRNNLKASSGNEEKNLGCFIPTYQVKERNSE